MISTSKHNNIPCYQRFQWLNNKNVIRILREAIKPRQGRGRKGYDRVLMIRFLIYKQLSNCSYRDLEGISEIDYSTFIKFRKRLINNLWFSDVFNVLSQWIISQKKESLSLIIDSSFVETYSKKKEKGSSYSGYKKKIGFKIHSIIDFDLRLPLFQSVSSGSVHDISEGRKLARGSSDNIKVKFFLADKGYECEDFVHLLKGKWNSVNICIPLRKTNQEKMGAKRIEKQSWKDLKLKERTIDKNLYTKRIEIERYFSRKKRVFNLGEEKNRGIVNFETNCYFASIAEILEWTANNYLLLIFHRAI